MFERYSEDARRALFFARARTQQRNGDSITPEDLLDGIVWASPHVIARVAPKLAEAKASSETAEDLVSRLLREAALLDVSKEIPFSDPTKLALGRGCEEADVFEHKTIGAKHLLLGLLRDEDSQASRTLREADVTLRELRRIVSEEPTEQS